MERAFFMTAACMGIACSQTVMSFEKLARLQDILPSDGAPRRHQASLGSTNRPDGPRLDFAQASSAYVRISCKTSVFGHRLESPSPTACRKIFPARLRCRPSPPTRVEKDVGVKEDAGHDDLYSPCLSAAMRATACRAAAGTAARPWPDVAKSARTRVTDAHQARAFRTGDRGYRGSSDAA